MSDKNFKDQTGSLFPGLREPVVSPSTTPAAVDKKRQKEQRTVSLGTKGETGQVVGEATRAQTAESSDLTVFPQYLNTSSQGRELRQYLQIVWKWWWLIAASTLVAATASFMVSSFMISPVYRASTKLLVDAGDEYSFSETIEYLTKTYEELLGRRPVIEAVAQALDLDPNETAEKVHIQAIPQTPLIELTVEDNDPHLAMEIANQIAVDFQQIARNSRWIQGSKLIVVEKAAQPRTPVAPRILSNMLIAALVGGMLASGAAFLIEYLTIP